MAYKYRAPVCPDRAAQVEVLVPHVHKGRPKKLYTCEEMYQVSKCAAGAAGCNCCRMCSGKEHRPAL